MGDGRGIFASSPNQSQTATLVAQVEGSVAGMIQYESQGDDGFGYDPVFYLPSYGKSMAQLPLEGKNSISHRADAARKAASILSKLTAVS